MPEYSPALSLFTAAFELGVAGWLLRAPGRPSIQRLVAAILALLAGYQLLEVFVCRAPDVGLWSRLAFADVVWLPPLGCLLLVRLAGPTRALWRRAVGVMLVLALALTVYVLVDASFVTSTVCKAVIATYSHPPGALEIYGAFYHIGLWSMMLGGLRVVLRAPDPVDRAHAADVVSGTIVFVVFALTTEIVFPAAKEATPSVMCHYALALAAFLARLGWREARARAVPAPA